MSYLSWDTEGGDRVDTNLLKKGAHVGVRVKMGGTWRNCSEMGARVERVGEVVTYRVSIPETRAEVQWVIRPGDGGLGMEITAAGEVEAIDLHIPFDPTVTPTTVIPHEIGEDGMMVLPAIVSAPDFGQMLLTDEGHTVDGVRLLRDRGGHWTTLVVEFARPKAGGMAASLKFVPFWLDAPEGLKDGVMWKRVRRGWFNAIQPSSKWGDQSNPFSAPAGVLANNVISDPGSCSLWFYADQAFFTPRFTAEISPMMLVRRTIEWWLDHRTRPTGEVVCYWDYTNFLDADAGPIIAAWDYVEATGDVAWLGKRVGQLEKTAEFLAGRDVDHDGLIEATQPGTPNTLQIPNRSCAWWDALNCGHKDAYTNAIVYRAFRCLADLESKLDRRERRERYTRLADALKAAYFSTLYNPATGCIAWWKDRDGRFHDFYSPTVAGMAIEYGLVPPGDARRILAAVDAKMKEVGFVRPDLGVPSQLVPVPRADYLQPNVPGLGAKEDGSDAFQQYMNGGITAGQTLHYLAARYVVGDPGPADAVLDAMLGRQAKGMFQNGVRDTSGQGIDWTTWTGEACGYEGYLADSFRFLQAALLREKAFRERLYRPLNKIQN